jgi:hypothetical protein
MALLAAAALMPASVAVVYDQSIDVTWIGGAVNDLWASCDGWDSGYCPMKCAQVTIEDDAPVTVATRVSRVNNEQHCFVLEDSLANPGGGKPRNFPHLFSRMRSSRARALPYNHFWQLFQNCPPFSGGRQEQRTKRKLQLEKGTKAVADRT